MTQVPGFQPGFANPVFDAQASFRTAMMAVARPGTVHDSRAHLEPPQPLHPATTALALALCDNDTPIWLDAGLAASAEVTTFLRFHTGARLVDTSADAAFAIISDPLNMPAWDTFALGTLEYPDRSTTLIVQVHTIADDRGWRLSGPGIKGETRFLAEPVPAGFLQRRADNHRLFPRGTDIFFAAGGRIAALPRTTRVLD